MLEQKANALLHEIKTEIGDAQCENDKNCAALAIGHRACGGPAGFLAYSNVASDVDKLNNLAQQHTATERQLNKLRGIMSICEMLLPPPVVCVNQRCVVSKPNF